MSFPSTAEIAGGAEYDIHSAKEFRIGTRGITEDGRVFRYCRASSNGISRPFWGGQCGFKYDTAETYDCLESTTSTAKVAGDFELTAVDTNTDHVADWFAEGYAALTVGSIIQLYRIRKNTVGHATTAVVFTLYDPLPIDVASGSQIQVFPSIYGSINTHHGLTGATERIFVCMPISTVTASYYFWGQTWGPCYGIPTATFSRTGYSHELFFSNDGGVQFRAASADGVRAQRAGHRLFDYQEDPTGVLIFFMLELQP